ncbi:DNA polymerase delta small subunit Cdc1 [Mucor velutinosus]|uniref:DNA polymerase delta small subunit Cdc1 n=1 Tax=Mucor velutinosus TaxID=708070 RepID=A0AAN7HS13_9FUNG|nr:DNA polymerase delta small subunit Cdc1 [Mucor velutinosus]
MKSMSDKRYFVGGCIALIIMIALSTFSRRVSILSALKSFGPLDSSSGPASRFYTASHCSNIEDQPNQCAFVRTSCHGFNAFYLELYYCSTLWKPMIIAILVTWLFVLFGAISVVASDFFCPNLQTISTKLQLSESMAGVTVLALGNGSPDLFSTFSAMDSSAGSMAIGELIGAAFFIVAIVSGCMGIIRPFQSQQITFSRDASFLTGAVAIMTWIVYHQQIHWYHSVILIGYYLFYVAAVVFGAYSSNSSSNGTTDPLQENKHVLHPEESTHLLSHAKSPRLSIPDRGFSASVQSNLSELNHLGHVIRPTSLNSSHRSIYQSAIPRSASTNGSILSTTTKTYRRPMTPRIGIRTSVFGAIEFQEQISHMRQSSHSSQHILSPTHHHHHHHQQQQQRRHRQQSMPPPMWQTLQLPSSHDLSKRQRASTMTDQPFPTATPSIHVVSPTTQQQHQHQEEQDYFTFISAQHDQPLFHIQPSSPPPSSHIPEIRLDVPSTTLLTPESRSIRTPSIISDYDLFVSARQSFELNPCSATPSFHKHLADHIMTSGIVGHDPLQSESSSLLQTLFPTLQDWRQKSLFSKWSALAALPLVLVFTLTLPVAEIGQIKVDDIQVMEEHDGDQDDNDNDNDNEEEEEEEEEESTVNYLSIPTSKATAIAEHDMPLKITVDDIDTKQGWNKQLLIIQCIISTAFILGVLAANQVIPSFAISLGLLVGSILAIYIQKTTASHEPPSWFWTLSFVGFFVALNWIFLLANEVVGLLQAFGQIFSISDAIMGLTVFALGNSIGDFVANTAIAKMGFPTMAISACYAGPLLNMVLGVGISSLYQFWRTGASYKLDIAPTIIISSAGLLTVLMSTLIAVSINGYRITKQLGWWMLRFGIEYSSPPLLFDDLKWSIKLFKGKIKTPEMLSIYVQIHETSPGSLRGIRKNVQLSIKINNTNPSSYYNDFGVGKRLQPVWFSEKNTKWGEVSIGTLSSIIPFLSRDQLSLSVTITILKSEVNNKAAIPTITPPFSRYIDSPEFSDVSFRVIEEDEDLEYANKLNKRDRSLCKEISLEKQQDSSQEKPDTNKVRVFHGHKNILAAISPWFHMLFTNGMRESLQNEITISGVQHDIFYRLLKYCYTFKMDINGVTDAYEMLRASDRFQIVNIREEALCYLRQELDEHNIWDIWECADMYGCEKTVNTCVSYASVEMKALVKHPSWLYAKASVIKMALDIEVGDLPEETELYEAVLVWANQRGANVTMAAEQEKEQAPLEEPCSKRDTVNMSMTRTQLLSSVVNVEPLAISAAVIEDEEDEEEEEEEEEEDQPPVIDYSHKVIAIPDPKDLEADLASILQCVRFPMMPPDYLANRVEMDAFIMSIDGMRDMLYEAYKYHAVLGTSSSFRCQPRRAQIESDEL